MEPLKRVTRRVILERGWIAGTSLEDTVALWLSRFRMSPNEVAQQYRVGKYRLDFAWPVVKMAIEADGWYHRSPDSAARDAQRDATLRADGWVILRVDDSNGEESLAEQVCRAVRLIRSELDQIPAYKRGVGKPRRGGRDG